MQIQNERQSNTCSSMQIRPFLVKFPRDLVKLFRVIVKLSRGLLILFVFLENDADVLGSVSTIKQLSHATA